MDIDFNHRVELLRLTVMRRATDLSSDAERRRFAENMAFVYRMDETSVLAVLDEMLGIAYPRAAVARASEGKITQRELAAVDD